MQPLSVIHRNCSVPPVQHIRAYAHAACVGSGRRLNTSRIERSKFSSRASFGGGPNPCGSDGLDTRCLTHPFSDTAHVLKFLTASFSCSCVQRTCAQHGRCWFELHDKISQMSHLQRQNANSSCLYASLATDLHCLRNTHLALCLVRSTIAPLKAIQVLGAAGVPQALCQNHLCTHWHNVSRQSSGRCWIFCTMLMKHDA